MNGIKAYPYLASLKNDSSGDPTINAEALKNNKQIDLGTIASYLRIGDAVPAENATDPLDKEIVFSKLYDFEFVSYDAGINESNDMFEYRDDSENNVIVPSGYDQYLNLKTETNKVITKEKLKFPLIAEYVDCGYQKVNSTLRDLYGGCEVSPANMKSIKEILSEFTSMRDSMLSGTPELQRTLEEKPLFVYRGGRAPWVNAYDDIYSADLPFTFMCSSFLSTSVDYNIARDFLYSTTVGNLIWKRKVLTTNFACTGSMGRELDDIEGELLFQPGQHVRVFSITLNEDGHPTMNGDLIDLVDPLPDVVRTKTGGGDKVVKEPDGTSPHQAYTRWVGDEELDAISRILHENEDRTGTPDCPFHLVIEDDERMITDPEKKKS
jgi:hypothetical protein